MNWKILNAWFYMARDIDKKNRITIIGGGPAGVMCAIEAAKNPNNDVTIVEQREILTTILPTGGGRCNLAHNEFNPVKLAGYFPRGEKFLYSIFTKFGTKETLDFFHQIGIKTKIQEDNRIFPISDSAKEVRNALLEQIKKNKIKQIKGRVYSVSKVGDSFELDFRSTVLHNTNFLVVATGGKESGFRLAYDLGHKIISPRPSLCALKIKETQFYELSGVSVQNLSAKVKFKNKIIHKLSGDMLFTHTSLSGPLILKISSLCALLDFNVENPLFIDVNFVGMDTEKFKQVLKEELENNLKKDLINVCTKYISKYLACKLLGIIGISPEIKCADVSKIKLRMIADIFTNYTFTAVSRVTQGAMVTAGGLSLKEINPKNIESKLHKNLFFCGEVLDIDGLTGGFNLQNCWSTGFIVGEYLRNL